MVKIYSHSNIENVCVYSYIQEETIRYVDNKTYLVCYEDNTLIKLLYTQGRFNNFKNLCHIDLLLMEILK